MRLIKPTLAAFAATLMLTPAFGGDAMQIQIEEAYARASSPKAMVGAVFMIINNVGGQDDRLIAAASDVAKRVEIHTHLEDANGVMRMVEVKDGVVIPASGGHSLERGGDHVMLMGLTSPLIQGETIEVILTFETAGDVTVSVPVDHERKASHGMKHGS